MKKAVTELGFIGFHFHPIMQHFAVNDRRHYDLFEEINALGAAVMIDVGTTGMGAGMPGGNGARVRHAHPSQSPVANGWHTPPIGLVCCCLPRCCLTADEVCCV